MSGMSNRSFLLHYISPIRRIKYYNKYIEKHFESAIRDGVDIPRLIPVIASCVAFESLVLPNYAFPGLSALAFARKKESSYNIVIQVESNRIYTILDLNKAIDAVFVKGLVHVFGKQCGLGRCGRTSNGKRHLDFNAQSAYISSCFGFISSRYFHVYSEALINFRRCHALFLVFKSTSGRD